MSSEYKRESIFILEAKKSNADVERGTCFAISSTLVVTAKHVIEDKDTFHCFTSDEYFNKKGKKLKLLKVNDEFDYAILDATKFKI